MGFLNRLAMQGLVKSQGIVKKRIELANTAIDRCAASGLGPRSPQMMYWQLHKLKMMNRFVDLQLRIGERAQRERRISPTPG